MRGEGNAEYRRMIHTARWVELRREKLTECPLCERCAAEGYVTAATEVHHAVPVEDAVTRGDRERLMFDYSNLRSLCHRCHVLTHTELGRSGTELTRRRNRMAVESFDRRYPVPDPDEKESGNVDDR